MDSSAIQELDVEEFLNGWLTNRFPAARCVTETPPPDSMRDSLPLIRSWVIGGAHPQPTMDRPTVDIEVYDDAPDDQPAGGPFVSARMSARALAKEVWKVVYYELPGVVADTGASIKRVNRINQPSWRPYDNTNLRRFGMTLQIVLHN